MVEVGVGAFGEVTEKVKANHEEREMLVQLEQVGFDQKAWIS